MQSNGLRGGGMHKELKMTRRATCLVIILMVGLIIISVPNVAFAKRSKVVYQGNPFISGLKDIPVVLIKMV